MRLPILALVTVFCQILLVNASTFAIGDVSKCTLTCLIETFTAANCTLTDLYCQCHDQPLVVSTSKCMLQNCPLADSLALGQLRDKTCNVAPQSRQRELLTVNLTMGPLAFIMVGLRIWSRYRTSQRIWLDDWVIVAAVFLTLPATAIAAWSQFNGLGKHTWDIPLAVLTKIFMFYYIGETFYLITLLLTKISILLFYLRIFPRTVSPRFHITTKVVLAFVMTSGIAILLLQIFQCLPVAYNWDKSLPGAKCLNVNALTYTHAGFSIAQDVIILVLPISQLATLHMDIRQRLAVILVFQVGAFACVTSMIRLRFLTRFGGTNSLDPTWDNTDATLWTAVEQSTGIICACLPAVRALLKPLYPTLRSFAKSHNSITSFRPTPEPDADAEEKGDRYDNMPIGKDRSRSRSSMTSFRPTPNSASDAQLQAYGNIPIKYKPRTRSTSRSRSKSGGRSSITSFHLDLETLAYNMPARNFDLETSAYAMPARNLDEQKKEPSLQMTEVHVPLNIDKPLPTTPTFLEAGTCSSKTCQWHTRHE